MQSTTYKDIIDGKIAEWQVNLKKIEEQAGKASSDSQSRSSAKVKDLKSAIDSATAQLQSLDAQETVENTMATKDKILEIFGSIDKQFIEFEDKTPFML
ncbi:hypothetical protein FCL47_19260 [Desulfopila sp. IMCC35006]|uniref:hypothetical protein n=1 Tax=Desulfopila sp. IMCC35006 TaxID=2569542 RepID=UPI0010ABD8DF|nr:hypothetical protein [Desulfopila sp. IMCC35006]TKB24323.1 hypothetical protein FCL47_19260 [Desulfopila sp. IMCC35006]